MQVFMQVLKPELGGEAAKTAGKAEGHLPSKGDGTFAALLESSDEILEGESPDTVEGETGEDSEAKRQPVTQDSREKLTVLSRQASLGGELKADAPIPAKTGEASGADAGKRPVPAEVKVEKILVQDGGPHLATRDAKPEGKDAHHRPAKGILPSDVPDRQAGGKGAETGDARDSDALRAEVRPRFTVSKKSPPVSDKAKSSVAQNAPIAGERRLKSLALPADRAENPRRTGAVDRATPEVKPKVPGVKPETPVLQGPDVRKAMSVPKDIPQANPTPERPGVTLPDQASETAVKVVAARVPPGVDKPAPPKSNRRAERELRAEVTIREPARKAAQAVKPVLPDPVSTMQSTLLPNEPFAVHAKAARDVLGGDAGAALTTALDAPEARRAPDGVPNRIEVQARPVVTQLVQAAKSAIDGTIEVKLSPEELGRVRLAMTTGEAGMLVTVTAERAETLDLIRRNIDLFAADLTREGFGDLSFAFGQEGAGEGRDHPGEKTRDEGGVNVSQMIVEQSTAGSKTPDGRLDIRL